MSLAETLARNLRDLTLRAGLAKVPSYRLFDLVLKRRSPLSPSLVRFTFGGPEIARVRTLAPDQRVKLLFPPLTAACRNFQPRATGADRCAASRRAAARPCAPIPSAPCAAKPEKWTLTSSCMVRPVPPPAGPLTLVPASAW